KAEEVVEKPEETPGTEEKIVEEEVENDRDDLPFPKATIVNMLRKHLSSGKQIKGQVKDEMNLWLGKMVERIAKKMDSHPYAYVDGGMLRDAIEPYETVQEIELEKERIVKQLESIKAACDILISEVDRKFRK
ncbi:MAG: hypothetical protein KAS30_00570, partial [Candidatus Diapherotrites archaeon]|nr:hypothetical protein [Candidatus Diapherotrites archaeon]